MQATAARAEAYEQQGHDAVRACFERPWLAGLLQRLLLAAPGGELLDLGCGDGAVARMAGLERYVGVDLAPPEAAVDAEFVAHDLADGLGPVGTLPFDLYLGSFGIASHLAPGELARLLGDIARHARPGALVAIEALGLHSLEWPQLWGSRHGRGRTIEYRLATDVRVHPWAPGELFALFRGSGIEPLGALDRTLQAAPKLAEGRYWPGLPDLRGALNALISLECEPAAIEVLAAPLPPLPACEAALVHHTLAARRGELLARRGPTASAIWQLEPRTAGGFGHGLLVVGRVRG
jgi:SAM-dependent methyltransferase